MATDIAMTIAMYVVLMAGGVAVNRMTEDKPWRNYRIAMWAILATLYTATMIGSRLQEQKLAQQGAEINAIRSACQSALEAVAEQMHYEDASVSSRDVVENFKLDSPLCWAPEE